MADQRLNIIFSGDASQLDKTIAQTEAQLQGLNSKLKTSVSGDTFKQATDGVARFEAKLGGLTTGSIAQLRRAAALLKNELSNLSPAGLSSNLGQGLSSALKTVEIQLKQVEDQAGLTTERSENLFKKLHRQVADFASLLPALGIGALIGVATTALEEFGKELFDVDEALFKASIEAAKFSASIGDIKSSIDNFFVSVDFENKLQKLKNQLTLGDKKAAVLNLDIDIKSATDNLEFVNEQLKKFTDKIGRTFSNQSFVLSKKGQELINSFVSSLETGTLIPDDLISKLSDSDQKIFKELNEAAANIEGLTRQQTRLKRTLAEDEINIELEKLKQLKDLQDKQKDDFEKFVNATITKAKQFVKEFGNAFVVPDLEETFFKNKLDVFKDSLKLLDDAKAFISGNQTALKIKLPVLITTETKLNDSDLKKFLRDEIKFEDVRTEKITIPVVTDLDFKLAESLEKSFEDFQDNVIKRGIEGLKLEAGIPISVELIFDPTLTKEQIALISKKLDLRQQFGQLGKIGFDAFNKIDFTNISAGIIEATKKLQQMLAVANTLAQSIGTGLSNAFNNVFDAVLEGKSVFKALGESVKALVVDTIKAVVQMFILRAVTAAIFPGAGGITAGTGGLGRLIGGVSGHSFNPSFGSLGGSRVVPTLTTRVSGTDLLFVLTQGQNTIGRAG